MFRQLLLLIIFFLTAHITQSQGITWSDNFESYEGTGSIPPTFGGGMRVYSAHGTGNSKALCIQFSSFKQTDSTITPLIGPIPPGSFFNFDYRFAAYVAGQAFNGFALNSDKVEVFVAADGQTFGQPLLSIDASNHSPTVDFSPRSVDLSNFEGQSIRIKIRGQRGNPADYFFDTDNFQVSQTNAINTSSIPDFIIYPNPSEDRMVMLQFPSPVKEIQVEVLNIVGAVVLKKTAQGQRIELDTEHLPKGIYYVKVGNRSKKQIKKLVLK